MAKKIYIELIGMPASGKSYYLKNIKKFKKEKVKSNNFEELNKISKIFFNFIYF